MKKILLFFITNLFFLSLFGALWNDMTEHEFVAEQQSIAINHNTGELFVAKSPNTSVLTLKNGFWFPVRGAQILMKDTTQPSLLISKSGKLFLSFNTDSNGWKVVVMTLEGASWKVLGKGEVSLGMASKYALAVDNSNTPFIAFKDAAADNKISVKKFNGTQWVYVGNPGFAENESLYNSLVFDKNDYLFFAFQDDINEQKTSVMTYTAEEKWEFVGKEGLSNHLATDQHIVKDQNGNIFMVYHEKTDTDEDITTILKFNQEVWTPVGAPISSDEPTSGHMIALDSSGRIFVAYQEKATLDYTTYQILTVMMYDRNVWTSISPETNQHLFISKHSLAVNESGTLFIAHKTNVMYHSLLLTKEDDNIEAYCDNYGFGGKRIQRGYDNGNNGGIAHDNILQEGEILFTTYICFTKESGEDATPSLLEISVEEKGANCTNGGTKIETGIDENRNNILDKDEIISTDFVCDGTPNSNGKATIIATGTESPGENCANGGEKITYGIDENENGRIDDNETTKVEYICTVTVIIKDDSWGCSTLFMPL